MPLTSTFQRSGLSPSYSPSLAWSAERQGRPHNRDTATSQSQDAAPSPNLPYSAWQVNYQLWQLIFTRAISAAVLEMLYKYREILLMLLMSKVLGPSLYIGEGSPTPGSTFPKLELYWCSPQCYQGSAGEHKRLCFMCVVTQHWRIRQHTKIQICFLIPGRSPRAPKQFNMLGKRQRWQVFLGTFAFLRNPFRLRERSV